MPIKIEHARGFVTWAIANKKLKSETVKAYISSLNVAHSLGAFEDKKLNSNPCIKMALLDIFPLRDKGLCPASALARLKKLTVNQGIFCESKPVFMFKSGKFLTKAIFNSWIAEILGDFTDDWHKITGHSFRSAIPTALSTHPKDYSTAIIKEWGGWVDFI